MATGRRYRISSKVTGSLNNNKVKGWGKHMTKNHKDTTALRGIQLTESKIKRLVKYYKRSGRLPEDWKYEPDKIRLYLE